MQKKLKSLPYQIPHTEFPKWIKDLQRRAKAIKQPEENKNNIP